MARPKFTIDRPVTFTTTTAGPPGPMGPGPGTETITQTRISHIIHSGGNTPARYRVYDSPDIFDEVDLTFVVDTEGVGSGEGQAEDPGDQ